MDSLMTGVSPDQRSVHGNALPDLAAIKNTEANILHQISELRYGSMGYGRTGYGSTGYGSTGYGSMECRHEYIKCLTLFLCRAVVDRSGAQGAKVTTSEQLQPVYEVKNIVQQNSQRLASLEQHAKVCGTWPVYTLRYIACVYYVYRMQLATSVPP